MFYFIPLHGCTLHLFPFLAFPLQSFPFPNLGGLVQVRVLYFLPRPQVLLHSPYADQSLQPSHPLKRYNNTVISQSGSQSVNQSIHPSIDPSINQWASQSFRQPVNQSTGHFRVTLCLCFKTSVRVKPFI